VKREDEIELDVEYTGWDTQSGGGVALDSGSKFGYIRSLST
jgi:hypothetical protein